MVAKFYVKILSLSLSYLFFVLFSAWGIESEASLACARYMLYQKTVLNPCVHFFLYFETELSLSCSHRPWLAIFLPLPPPQLGLPVYIHEGNGILVACIIKNNVISKYFKNLKANSIREGRKGNSEEFAAHWWFKQWLPRKTSITPSLLSSMPSWVFTFDPLA